MDIFIYMIIIALSLSIDALGIGVSYGIRDIKTPITAKIIICSVSFIILLLSAFFGNIICEIISERIAELIGIAILIILGIWIIIQGTTKKKEYTCDKKTISISMKIIQTPELCDLNKSSVIDPLESVYLGIALSIDSIGVGITSSAFGFNKLIFSFMVCILQIILLSLGIITGKRLNKIKYIDKISNIFSGGALILIACLKLLL